MQCQNKSGFFPFLLSFLPSSLLRSDSKNHPSQLNDQSCVSLQVVLGPLIAIALKLSNIHERTGRRGPNVITWASGKTHTHAYIPTYAHSSTFSHTQKKSLPKCFWHFEPCFVFSFRFSFHFSFFFLQTKQMRVLSTGVNFSTRQFVLSQLFIDHYIENSCIASVFIAGRLFNYLSSKTVISVQTGV